MSAPNSQTLHFELVSPQGMILARAVGMVTLPGDLGELGILPGHAPLMTSLQPGLIGVYEQGELKERIYVAGGFAEVQAERCTVLAEQAEPLAKIDSAQLAKAIEDLQARLSQVAADQPEHASLKAQLQALQAKQQVLQMANAGQAGKTH